VVEAARWTVTRRGDRVRIDLIEADAFSSADTDAIASALEGYLADDEVRVIQLGGPVLLRDGPPDGLSGAIRSLGELARRRGKRFDVGPI
jgi:hypothetical protein